MFPGLLSDIDYFGTRMNDFQEARPRAEEIGRYREKLMRFALQRLHNPVQAEDAVQDTLIAAIEGIDRYAADAALGTWLTGILKHKIADCVRSAARERRQIPEDPDTLHATSCDPEKEYSCRGFLERLESCMTELPARAARVFVLREVLGFNTVEVCKQLAISSTNCSVLLHRARARLRERLGGEQSAVW